jgi:hypothetical protein
MSPDLTFILMLGFRMAVTAAFVVTASVITERSGPVIGALIATLPISAGPSYVFLSQSITTQRSSPRAHWRACRSMRRPSCSA